MSEIKIHSVETGEIIERKMNAEELAQLATDKAKATATAETEAIKAASKSVLLTKLGITEDEAKLLLS